MRLLAALALWFVAAIAQGAQWVTAPGAAVPTQQIDALLARHPLGPKENIKVLSLAKSEHGSQLLVQVRDREPLHYHADSDITVFLVRGQGKLRLDGRDYPVKSGDVMHIPRGVIHAYINQGPVIGVAIVSFSPAPGPEDRVLIKEPSR